MKSAALLPLLGLACSLALPAAAQKLSVEKFHDVSTKAKRGYLEDVAVDNAAGKIDLRFITKSTDKQVQSQTYHFDTQYNLLGVDETTIPLEKVKGYRGENYSKEAVTVETAGSGSSGAGALAAVAAFKAMATPPSTILIRHRRIDYKWSWLGGGYRKKVKLLSTEKPKTESGGGFSLVAHVDDDANGGVLVLARENVRLTNAKAVKIGYHLLYFNNKAELVRDTYLDVPDLVPQTFVQMAAVGLDQDEEADDSEQAAPDVAIMLTYPKGTGKQKGLHPPTEYQYLRVSNDGLIKEKLRVDSPVGAWLVSGFVPMTDGGVLLYGPANDDADKHYADALPDAKEGMTPEEAFKAKNFLLGKIKDGKVAWVTKTDLKEFESRQQVPPGQKRTPDYTGKRFYISQAYETPNGEIFIGGQNFKVSGGGNKMLNTLANGRASGNDPIVREYGDLLLFHFDGQGRLRSQYGLRRAENNKTASLAPTAQFMRATADGKAVYWTIFEMDGWRTVNGLTEDGGRGGLFEPTERETISYPSVTRIDLAAAKIGPQKTFGVTKEGKYYVSNRYSTLPVGASTQQVVFFGENKSGKTMWFAQMPLE